MPVPTGCDKPVGVQVDLTWHGHHHSYQRTCPVYSDECKGYREDGTAKAPIHLVIGNAGADLCHNVQPVQPSYFEVNGVLDCFMIFMGCRVLFVAIDVYCHGQWHVKWPLPQLWTLETRADSF